jgi:hypothetical protein
MPRTPETNPDSGSGEAAKKSTALHAFVLQLRFSKLCLVVPMLFG